MADYENFNITATNVAAVYPTADWGTAGGTIVAGEAVYRNSDRQWLRASASSAEASGSTRIDGIRIALSSAVSGQQVSLCPIGALLTVGAVLTPGLPVVVSPNGNGKIGSVIEFGAGYYLTYLGTAINTTQFYFLPFATGKAYV